MSREKDVEGKKPMLVPLQSEKRPKGTPVYRDPENPFNTWSGYGKRPVWLQERLSDGYLLDEMKLPGAVVDRDTKSPRYRDPANPDNTWTGVGRRPKWLVELLENGVDLDDLKIRERE